MKQLILFPMLVLIAIMARAQHATPHDPYKIVVIDGGISGIYSSDEQKTYMRLLVYIVNNSNDTLNYCGTDWLYKDIFIVSKNSYVFLENQDSKKQLFIKNTIPPHRSQEIELLLSESKSPDTMINLNIQMKLFRWVTGELDNLNNKNLIGSLTDNVTIKYDKQHNQCFDKQDTETLYQKENKILPDINLHLLTASERKSYILIIDQRKITVPHDSLLYKGKRVNTFNVPVLIRNNSNDTLKFMTMSCSWDYDFDIDNKDIHMNGWNCDKNVPKIIKVPPHRGFLRVLPVNIDEGQLKKGIRFKVSMNLTIDDGNHHLFELYTDPTGKYNQIWSNEVVVPQ
jgi:hypothetical protein